MATELRRSRLQTKLLPKIVMFIAIFGNLVEMFAQFVARTYSCRSLYNIGITWNSTRKLGILRAWLRNCVEVDSKPNYCLKLKYKNIYLGKKRIFPRSLTDFSGIFMVAMYNISICDNIKTYIQFLVVSCVCVRVKCFLENSRNAIHALKKYSGKFLRANGMPY